MYPTAFVVFIYRYILIYFNMLSIFISVISFYVTYNNYNILLMDQICITNYFPAQMYTCA